MTQWLPKMKSNTKYHLTFDIRLENVKPSGKNAVMLNFGAPGNIWYPKNSYLGDMPWTSQGWLFTTGEFSEKHPAYLSLRFFPGTGTVWFDNLRLKEIKNTPEQRTAAGGNLQ